MENLQTINTNLEACLNLAVTSAGSETVSFAQHDIRDKLRTMLEAAKQLELWFVETSHRKRYPAHTSELEELRAEVAVMQKQSKLKEEALDNATRQVAVWTKMMEALQTQQTSAMFDLVLRTDGNFSTSAQPRSPPVTTDEMWWGQQTTDESEL